MNERCSFCGASIPPRSNKCPVCGKRVSLISMPKSNSPLQSHSHAIKNNAPLKRKTTVMLDKEQGFSIKKKDVDEFDELTEIANLVGEDDFDDVYDAIENKKGGTLVGFVAKVVIVIIIITLIIL